MFYVVRRECTYTCTHMKTLRCAGIPMLMCMRSQMSAQAPHFKIQLSHSSGISALHAEWLWVSARHPQCETADNKIMAMSAAFVVQPDDSVLLADQKRAYVAPCHVIVSHGLRKEKIWQCSSFSASVEWFFLSIYLQIYLKHKRRIKWKEQKILH